MSSRPDVQVPDQPPAREGREWSKTEDWWLQQVRLRGRAGEGARNRQEDRFRGQPGTLGVTEAREGRHQAQKVRKGEGGPEAFELGQDDEGILRLTVPK